MKKNQEIEWNKIYEMKKEARKLVIEVLKIKRMQKIQKDQIQDLKKEVEEIKRK